MAQGKAAVPSGACCLLCPWQMGRGAGSWGAVPGHVSRPELGVFLIDAVCFRGEGALTAGAD